MPENPDNQENNQNNHTNFDFVEREFARFLRAHIATQAEEFCILRDQVDQSAQTLFNAFRHRERITEEASHTVTAYARTLRQLLRIINNQEPDE
jgi:hypothetical protein